MLVAILERFKQYSTGIPRLFFIVVRFLHNAIKEFTTAHFLRHEIKEFGFFKHVVQANNVGVLELLEHGNLVVQCRRVFGSQLGLSNDLDGKRQTRCLVRAFIDHTKGTRSQFGPQFVRFREFYALFGQVLNNCWISRLLLTHPLTLPKEDWKHNGVDND
jgi:hypothetical protein